MAGKLIPTNLPTGQGRKGGHFVVDFASEDFQKNQSAFSDWTEMALLQPIPFKGSLSSCDFGGVGGGLDFANCRHDIGRSVQKRQQDSGPKFIDLRDFDFDAVR